MKPVGRLRKERKQTMNDFERTALDYFEKGYNCSQAVFTTYAKTMGFDEGLALRVATQFGGGARKGEMCGAVSGALMVLGLKYGHDRFGDTDQKSRAYAISEQFMDRFIAENGSVVCRNLLGYDICVPADKLKINELGLFKTVCPKMIASAARILGEMIEEIGE